MGQKRIDKVSNPSHKPSKSFLDFPPSVRRQIYEEAGLWAGKDLALMRWPLVSAGEFRKLGLAGPLVLDNFVYNVLRTCRTIHDEVKFFVYSENRIVVSHYDIPYGLQYLNRLPPQICSQLGDLFVHLYFEPSHGCLDGCSRPTTLSRSWIEAWQSAATHVLTHGNPRKLKLHLICETGDSEATRAVLQPLIDHPGSLADCRLNLGSGRNSRVCAMARRVALQAKGIDPDLPKTPFRFLDLPVELRLRILEFTDLVIPCGHAQWSPKKGFHLLNSGDTCVAWNRRDPGDRHWDFNQNWEPSKKGSMTISPCDCQSGYSSLCHCWKLPESLMLVNRSMYELAISVFYSCNRIIIVPDPHPWRTNLSPKDKFGRLSASRFITRPIYPTTLSHLRVVEIVFPGFYERHLCDRPDDPLFLDWRFAVDHLRAHANLPVLKLIVHMRMTFGELKMDAGFKLDREAFEKWSAHHHADPALELRPHSSFLETLKVLREGGLSQLFIFLEWGWHWSPQTEGPWDGYREGRTSLDDHVDLLEIWLERMVMGEDYDSSAVGKMEETRSNWMPFVGY